MNSLTLHPDSKPCPVCGGSMQRVTATISGVVETYYACGQCRYRVNRNYGEPR